MRGRTITILPVKNSGRAILYPTQTAQVNRKASSVVIGNLLTNLQGCAKFCYGDHTQLLRDGQTEIRGRKYHNTGESLISLTGGIYPKDARNLLQGQKKVA